MPEAANPVCCYWDLIVCNSLWLAGLLPGIDPRRMTAGDALSAALAYVHQEMQAA